MKHFFAQIQVDTFAEMHTSVKLLGGDADVDHTQTIVGDTVKLLGGYIPPSPPARFRHPWVYLFSYNIVITFFFKLYSDSLPFYAHIYTGNPSYTDEE